MTDINNLTLVYTSTTGRSGTGYFSNLVNRNAINATAEHDPPPRGYGDPILWYDNDEIEKLDNFAQYKLNRIKRGIKYNKILNLPVMNKISGRKKTRFRGYLRANREMRKKIPTVPIKDIYVESTHSFNKSFHEAMIKLRPDLYIVHLIRNPLEVAKSFYNRRTDSDERDIYLLEPDYKKNILKLDLKLTGIQKYLWYWIEIELRHHELVNNYDSLKIIDFNMEDFSDQKKIQDLFKFLGIEYEILELDLDRNKNTSQTILDGQDLRDTKQLLQAIPDWVFDNISYKQELLNVLNESN